MAGCLNCGHVRERHSSACLVHGCVCACFHERPKTILDLVKSDLDGRDAKGRQTYGSSLRVDSANDALQFAYEEALDLCMYLRQEIERRKQGK